MHPYLEITRPANCVLTAVGVAVGAFVAVGPELAGMAPQLALGCGAAMACVAGGNVLNDWFDRETDRANHPQRPLPSGRLQPAATERKEASAMPVVSRVRAALYGGMPVLKNWLTFLTKYEKCA